jgi:hypothetical protein
MLSGTCRWAHRSSSACTVPLSPRYSAIRSPANVAGYVFFFRTSPDRATGYQKSGLIPVSRKSVASRSVSVMPHQPLVPAGRSPALDV